MNIQSIPGATPCDAMGSLSTVREESTPRAPAVRWLAELCGVTMPEIALPRLFTDLLKEEDLAGKVQNYLSWWIKHADEGSSFANVLKSISDAPDESLIQILQQRRYDGLCYLSEGEIIGHVFFQKHDTEVCAFSAAVDPQFRGRRLWVLISLDFVAHAAGTPAVLRASVGTGRNPVARHLIKLIARQAPALGWQARRDGWIEFASPDREDV